jgi:Skp family chaperone for outer membrane proteins
MMRSLVMTVLLLASGSAWAEKICAADFQKAVEDTNQGKAATTRIESLNNTRSNELEKLKAAYDTAVQDYSSRQMILSADARAAEEQKLMQQQGTLQQKYVQYQEEMQRELMNALQSLGEKMKVVAQTVGKEQACTLMLDKSVVIYSGAELVDLTSVLVTRYNTTHK